MRECRMSVSFLSWCALSVIPLAAPALAQEAGGVTVVQVDDTVKIRYIINAGRPGDLCRTTLLVSTNGGMTYNIRPRMVKGLDRLVPAGKVQELLWYPLKEGIEVNGESLMFKVIADIQIISEEIEFIPIMGGEFRMGDFQGNGDPDELPVHAVTLGNFELGMYEVTNRQFARFLTRNGSDRVRSGEFAGELLLFASERGLHYSHGLVSVDPGTEDLPVCNVTWFGANEFCRSLGARLPTEAEWEFAARVQGKPVQYGNGKDTAHPEDINYDASRDSIPLGGSDTRSRKMVMRAGMFPANGLGLFDMSGNVWEWCQDWYDPGFYEYSLNHPRANPAGPWFGDFKVIRGGGFGNDAHGIRTTDRSYKHPGRGSGDVGFRVARN